MKQYTQRFIPMSIVLSTVLVCLSACGGGGGDSTSQPAASALAAPVPTVDTASSSSAATAADEAASAAFAAATAALIDTANKGPAEDLTADVDTSAVNSVIASPVPVVPDMSSSGGLSTSTAEGDSIALSSPTTMVAMASNTDTGNTKATATTTVPVVYTAPITITKGGTYTGNWENTNPDGSAVVIATTEPVTIQNCNIRTLGVGIRTYIDSTNVTVRGCRVQNITPNIAGKSAEHFTLFWQPKSIVIENNEITGGLGMYVDGGGKGADQILVRYNKHTNVDGRKSDGKGGYQNAFNIGQFTQLSKIQGIASGEISWNEVINAPYQSRVEDNINMYLTRGLPNRPFPIQNNYIQGGYPANPQTDGYSGGGIIVDGSSKTPATAAAYFSIINNQVVSTTNYGIAISSGIKSEIRNNRVVSNGLLPSGERIAAANVGIYIWDINKDTAAGSFFGNVASGNYIAWINKTGARNDAWMPNCDSGGCVANSALTLSSRLVSTATTGSNSATVALEAAEYATWKTKLTTGNVQIGVK